MNEINGTISKIFTFLHNFFKIPKKKRINSSLKNITPFIRIKDIEIL